ncbi:hypothetical protein N9489_00890 [Methylophilaceae bacterium]|nr:hypothetical protein [Methylophilaceae bacterium]
MISKIDDEIFEVTLTKDSTTIHRITLSSKFYKKLSNSKISEIELIKKTFEFLLERESNESILKEFNLEMIENYFPEYPLLIKKM